MTLAPRVCSALLTILALSFVTSFQLAAQTPVAQQEPNRQLVQTNAPPPAAARRIALVIGNGAYTNAPPLKNPPNDARDMAANLKTLGFEVSSGVNVNQREMKRLIREFGQKLKAGGNGLFYYAGHGVQARGRNYIIPVDADIQSEADVEDSGVDVGLVLNYMDDAQNGLNIVILDACRNNPFSRSFRSASEGLAQVDAPTGTLIAYATAPGRVAADGAGENGLYTSELLQAMRLPGLSATDMFMQVRAEVMKKTGNKQVPWEASSLVGSFYFSGGTNSVASNAAGEAPSSGQKFDAAAFEYNYWDSIKNSTNADDFTAYLAKYPEGQFAALAKNRIKSLEGVAKAAEPVPSTSRDTGATEIAFWDSVKNSTSASDYRAYLEKYPNGEFTALAKSRLAPLENAEKEKEKAAEIDRNTKRFDAILVLEGSFWANTYDTVFPQGLLFVAPDSIRITCNSDDASKCFKSWTMSCDVFKSASIKGFEIRGLKAEEKKYHINTASAARASEALAAIREVCKKQ